MLFINVITICLYFSLLSFEIVLSKPVIISKIDALTYLKRYGYKTPKCRLADLKQSSTDSTSISTTTKWNKRQLTWSFRGNTQEYERAIEKAFKKWREIIPQFRFNQVCATCNADIYISFQPVNHRHDRTGKVDSFPEHVVAHAYPPKDGIIHFNRETQWTHSFKESEMINFYLIAVHEIGHVLGYEHNGDPHNQVDSSSIMFPAYFHSDKGNLFTDSDRTAMRKIYTDTINWNGNDWANNCDFYKNDLKHQQTSANQCHPTCLATEGCTHYAWSTHNGGTCWMKTRCVTKADAFRTDDPNMVCGIINRK